MWEFLALRSESCSVVSTSLQPHGLYNPWNSAGQNAGRGNRSLLQGIFPTQGQKSGLPHCWQILYQLSHQGSPRILEWVASSGNFPTQESNRGLLQWRQILQQLSCYGSPKSIKGFPGGSVVKNPLVNAGERGSIPGQGRFSGRGNGYPLRYYCLESSMDRRAW